MEANPALHDLLDNQLAASEASDQFLTRWKNTGDAKDLRDLLSAVVEANGATSELLAAILDELDKH